MADYVSGTDLYTLFWGRLKDKSLLKVPLPSKLIPHDEGAGTQVEKRKRNKKMVKKKESPTGHMCRCGAEGEDEQEA